MKGEHLFIAVPELRFNVKLLEEALKRGLITKEQHDRIDEQRRIASKADRIAAAAMKNGSLIDRMLGVAPELINIETVNLLRSGGLITNTEGHALRIAIRTLSAATRGGLPTDARQLFARVSRILGAQLSYEHVDLLLSMKIISKKDAERYRLILSNNEFVTESLAKVKRAKSLTDALLVIGEISITDSAINTLVNTGLLPARTGRVYKTLIKMGVKEWKVFSGARAAEGWRRRALLMLTGSINQELLDFLRANRIISVAQYKNMQVLEILARNVNDNILESGISRKYRVRPGEAPIKTFARASRVNDQEILRLLATAARESSQEAAKLARLGKAGANIRSAQYRFAAAGLHQAMRNMWDGVGYLTIWGERAAAEAAAESVYALQARLLKDLPPDLRRSLYFQSKAGVDSYISRQDNTLQLSRRVYKNMDLYQNRVDQRISVSLLRGQGAAEIRNMVLKYISPNVPGGASYAAMRLARTEINNAFHFSQIRYSREQPWVRGYQWHTSESHKTPDRCDEYARDDHDNLGPGVFKKANVPGKPHPQCLCYITTVVMDIGAFQAAFRAGRFNSYLDQIERGEAFDNYDSGNLSAFVQTNIGNVRSGTRL